MSPLAATASQGDWHEADRDVAAVDAALVAAFRNDDVFAFESLYRLHHRYVEMLARRIIIDPHRAEDIAQEAFLRLVRQLLSHDGEIRVRAWLHRTTTNLAIDEHRRLRTMQHYQEQQMALAIEDPTLPLYSETWTAQAGTLVQMQNDAYSSIASGQKPLSYLSEVVKDWKSQGGDQSRKEFQQSLEKCKT